MARHKSDRIRLLQKLAGQYEQIAAQALGKSTNNLLSQVERLAQLRQFREDYHRQFNLLGQQGIDASSMVSFQNFLAQLDTAIAQQQQVVDAAQTDKQEKKNTWEGKHVTTRVYDKTLERTLKKEHAVENRKRQRESDDRHRPEKPTNE